MLQNEGVARCYNVKGVAKGRYCKGKVSQKGRCRKREGTAKERCWRINVLEKRERQVDRGGNVQIKWWRVQVANFTRKKRKSQIVSEN